MGENISQAFQFVVSGNAALGFVSWSQVLQSRAFDSTSCWLVPAELHTPIIQQAIALTDEPATWDFIQFTTSETALKTIIENGYSVP